MARRRRPTIEITLTENERATLKCCERRASSCLKLSNLGCPCQPMSVPRRSDNT